MPSEVYETARGGMLTYVGETPWHKLGTKVPAGTTPSEAGKISGADQIVVVPQTLYRLKDDGQYEPLLDRFEIVRQPWAEDPDPAYLGVGSKDYECVQNADLFRRFDRLGKHVDVVGVLDKGAVTFMTLIGDDFELLLPNGNKDHHQMYLLILEDKHPGKAIKVIMSPVRTVCMNTVRLAEAQQRFTLNVSHNTGANDMTEWVSDTLARIASAQQAVRNAMQMMADTPIAAADASAMFRHAFPVPDAPGKVRLGDAYFANLTEDAVLRLPERDKDRFTDYMVSKQRWVASCERMNALRAQAEQVYIGESTQSELAGTVYGAYNAVTWIVDHGGSEGTKAAKAALFGERSTWATRAGDFALKLVQN